MAPQDHDLCHPKDRAMEKTTEARASPATAPEFTAGHPASYGVRAATALQLARRRPADFLAGMTDRRLTERGSFWSIGNKTAGFSVLYIGPLPEENSVNHFSFGGV